MSVPEAREAQAAFRSPRTTPLPTLASVEDIVTGPVPLRVYRPQPVDPTAQQPLVVFFHGGAWVMGSLDSHDPLCRQIAYDSGATVISVDYRLAPEHRFPAAVNDGAASVRWLYENCDSLNLDSHRIIVAGDSAGANIAAVMAIMSRDGDLPTFRAQLLFYPCTDLTLSRRSHDIAYPGLTLTGRTMVWSRQHYLNDPREQVDWRASPVFAPRLAGLPPTYILTVGLDPLSDDGDAYARRLIQANVSLTRSDFPGQAHGFLIQLEALPTARAVISEIARFVRSVT